MPTFRGEYEITGDLVLPDDLPEVKMTSASGYEITLRNGPQDSEGHIASLVAIVIGEVDEFERANNHLRSELAGRLDLLAFATQSRFKIVAPRRVIEWEERKKTRRVDFITTYDRRYPPYPELSQKNLNSASELDRTEMPTYTRRALKYFRLGLLAASPEDQFMQFWLALEFIAENTGAKEPVTRLCQNQKCKKPLLCECGTEQTRTPMATDRIRQMAADFFGKNAGFASKTLIDSRNRLMHGSSVDSIEKAHKVSFSEIVNNLGGFVWQVIFMTIPADDNGEPVEFADHGDGFVNVNLNIVAHGTFDYDGDQVHPADHEIPSGTTTVIVEER
jgi:hypothetical protein